MSATAIPVDGLSLGVLSAGDVGVVSYVGLLLFGFVCNSIGKFFGRYHIRGEKKLAAIIVHVKAEIKT
ncbi:MAG: hypothetical protein OSJ43_11225 [Oscillospiraceae bacterium]|nr:hypothetical protein [Oscillospiraceae bacterium]